MSLFRRHRVGLDDAGRQLAATVVPRWDSLTGPEQERLLDDTDTLLRSKTWEAARAFELTEAMRTHIAAQAALLILGLHIDAYRRVRSIIVHPATIVSTGVRAGPVPGVVQDGPLPILGEAGHGEGPILVAWDTVAAEARHPDRGHNVVFHEFAHKLDMLDGDSDGMPPLPDPAERERWSLVCDEAFRRLRRSRIPGVLREYAATNAAEFFAVATEVFFTTPGALRQHERGLYDVLRGFYRQDPADR